MPTTFEQLETTFRRLKRVKKPRAKTYLSKTKKVRYSYYDKEILDAGYVVRVHLHHLDPQLFPELSTQSKKSYFDFTIDERSTFDFDIDTVTPQELFALKHYFLIKHNKLTYTGLEIWYRQHSMDIDMKSTSLQDIATFTLQDFLAVEPQYVGLWRLLLYKSFDHSRDFAVRLGNGWTESPAPYDAAMPLSKKLYVAMNKQVVNAIGVPAPLAN